MNTIVLKDLWRYEGVNCHKKCVQLKYRFFVPGFRYSYLLRKCQSCKPFVRWFYRLCLRRCSLKTHIQIPWHTTIGEGLYIGHWGTIVINPEAVIGKNFSCAGSILIGNSQGKRAGTPVIGNNVRMGQFSVVVGGVHIGNDVVIAPGAFVNFSVPDNSIVIGNPAKVIHQDSSPAKKYIVYSVEDYR